MEVHIGHCSSILNRLTCLHSSRVCHTGCQGQGCFAQEGEAEAEAREVAAEDRSREAGGAEARGGAETQGHGGGRGPAAPEGRPARAAGAGDGWTAARCLLLSPGSKGAVQPGAAMRPVSEPFRSGGSRHQEAGSCLTHPDAVTLMQLYPRAAFPVCSGVATSLLWPARESVSPLHRGFQALAWPTRLLLCPARALERLPS
ncbi:ribosome biogenesis protein SLX9 homolog isoform X7 [Kogia breviceps]|uniref:ribosome biogenesis protein SLX9 homolog isoform X7 n=1 Tax=Kogia breviceps TaxID=27615 RepID=UPI0034D15BAC